MTIRTANTGLRGLLTNLSKDQRGTTVMEFGLMVTVFMTLLLGLFDLGQLAYANAILRGATQDAARDSSLETGNTTTADAAVTSIIRTVAPDATVTSSRVSYFDFEDVERPESWNDENDDGSCNDGEAYVDENGNGNWDSDIGVSGNGGAGDVVIYTVTVTYDPLFPNPFLPGGARARKITSSAVKKNQPFADQANYGSDAGICD
ncbi:TadE/TadG family type IV pilus assembly protein [Pontixanthobacter aquaemixtae]|uniref:Pilus assembly protein n=1 Tax=Pontixanthobacter aquaemixtae TaxID=1958940 RepID=A0A844ZTG8_9SPHN|nr:TadE/TadG family type IV pilus assembly protein [Pontixanthobacter aquaemixtae]MXO90296.1 pilus assembly protein [Pontixanthobacter aquaemixtae]